MTFSFADLKRSQGNLEKINAEAARLNKGNYSKDERYWQPVIDKGGEGSAVIRFLPAPGEEPVFVRKYSYGFKNPKTGLWFIENSPTTLELPDPVAEYNSALWNSGPEANKDIARKQKRRLGYISNILVVKHRARPEDEGKVFLYEYGKKIYDKLVAKMNPDDPDDEAMNPFCFFAGANFKLRIKNNEAGFRSYDDSSFDFPAPVSDSDAKMEAIWKKTYSLQAEIALDKFKSYDELKKRFNKVIGLAGDDTPTNAGDVDDEPVREAVAAPSTAAQFESRKKPAEKAKAPEPADLGSPDDEDFFASLAKG